MCLPHSIFFPLAFVQLKTSPAAKPPIVEAAPAGVPPPPSRVFFAAVPAPLTRHHGQRLGGWDRYKLVYIYQVQEREIGREQQSDRVQWEVNILTVLNGEDEVGANLGEETRAPQAPSAPAVLSPAAAMTYSSHSLEQQ